MKKLFIFLLLPQLSFGFFCPTNFNQINFGMSKDQVIATCGKADKEEVTEIKPGIPQEWDYFIQPPALTPRTTTNQVEGNIKTQFVLDANGKLINLTVNGMGMTTTSICAGHPIQLGDDKDKIRAACGEPGFIAKSAPDNSHGILPAKQQITTLYYNSTPPVKLIFENNLLVRKE